MNDFSELENELKKLRPAPPSPVLFERVEQALENRSGIGVRGQLETVAVHRMEPRGRERHRRAARESERAGASESSAG